VVFPYFLPLLSLIPASAFFSAELELTVSRFLVSTAASALAILVLFSAFAPAQEGKSSVALVDLGKIVQTSKQFQMDVEAAAESVGNFEEKITRAQKEIQDVVSLLEKAPEGSEQQQQLQQLIQTIQTETQKELQGMQQKMQEAERDVLIATYKKIQSLLNDHCTKNGIDVVLRYDSEPLDPSDPQALSAGLNNRIMWHSGIDITDKILAELDKDVPVEAEPGLLEGIEPGDAVEGE
jgi:Skp family chaperone for outer membrane proteins